MANIPFFPKYIRLSVDVTSPHKYRVKHFSCVCQFFFRSCCGYRSPYEATDFRIILSHQLIHPTNLFLQPPFMRRAILHSCQRIV